MATSRPPRRIPPSAVPRQWKPPQGPRRSRNLLPIQWWPSKIWAIFCPMSQLLGSKKIGDWSKPTPKIFPKSYWLMFTFELAREDIRLLISGIHNHVTGDHRSSFYHRKWGSGRNGRGEFHQPCAYSWHDKTIGFSPQESRFRKPTCVREKRLRVPKFDEKMIFLKGKRF